MKNLETFPRKRVTIVAEAVIESRITDDLVKLGAHGYTVFETRGLGARGRRDGTLDQHNVQIETIVSDELAEAILSHVAATYFEDYAVIAYVDSVFVLRGSKYA